MDVQTTQGPMIANARVLDPPRLLYQGRQPTIVCCFRSHSYIKENTDINYSWPLLGTPRRCLEYVSTFTMSVCYHTYSFLSFRVGKQFYKPCTIRGWIVVSYDPRFNEQSAQAMVQGLVSTCKETGK